ncbi:MAG TPA: alternative ribosome rescue aminoacyl-tRNA hydrolase ArfB [Rhodoblastus sp.]|nr:alternative ribosome rescue aminoacyl-tRNA hydrolase ArfB [Rhodoblastus sp.]
MIEIAPGLIIDERDLEERFVRAAGPGGQNVNKLASAVELRFNLAACATLPDDIRWRLARLAGRRLNREGVLVIQAQRFRTQDANRRDAMARLAELIREAAIPPAPPRKKTAVPRSQKRARLETKRKDSVRKAGRQRPRGDD